MISPSMDRLFSFGPAVRGFRLSVAIREHGFAVRTPLRTPRRSARHRVNKPSPAYGPPKIDCCRVLPDAVSAGRLRSRTRP